MRARPGDVIEIDIDRAAMEGRGVGRIDELVVFVDKALPGEKVRARVRRSKKSFLEARAIEVLRPSPQRVAARCVHVDVCGGCSWQELDYAAQLEAKTALVRETLERIGGFRGIEVPPALASPDVFYYRNKMEFSFFAGRAGEIVLGLHVPGTYDQVFDLEACHLMSPRSNGIVARVRELATRSGRPAYHLRRHQGFWRYLVVREAKSTGQTMVNLVTADGAFPDRQAFVDALTGEFPEISSLLWSINSRRATIAVGEREEVLHGAREIEEMLGDLRFRIGANTFFQTNTRQAERLFGLAVEACGLTGSEDVLDLYAGTGAISLFLARRARHVTGIELVPESVAMAKKNAAANGITNCTFLTGEVRSVLAERPDLGAAKPIVVLDPPRAGLHADIVTSLRAFAPRRIVYVSCNPATLARDLQLLSAGGLYTLQSVQPVDMFPHTLHIECVAVLEAVG